MRITWLYNNSKKRLYRSDIMPLSYNSYIIITVESFKNLGGGGDFVDCWFLAHSYGCKVVSTSVFNFRKIENSFHFFFVVKDVNSWGKATHECYENWASTNLINSTVYDSDMIPMTWYWYNALFNISYQRIFIRITSSWYENYMWRNFLLQFMIYKN